VQNKCNLLLIATGD